MKIELNSSVLNYKGFFYSYIDILNMEKLMSLNNRLDVGGNNLEVTFKIKYVTYREDYRITSYSFKDYLYFTIRYLDGGVYYAENEELGITACSKSLDSLLNKEIQFSIHSTIENYVYCDEAVLSEDAISLRRKLAKMLDVRAKIDPYDESLRQTATTLI